VLAVLYLIAAFLAGLVAVQRLIPGFPPFVRLAGALVGGILLTGWVTFLIAFGLSSVIDDSTLIGAIGALAFNVAVVVYGWRALDYRTLRVTPVDAALLGLSLMLSFWLMDSRLSGDPLTVSANTWGDTALHISLARSFSEAHNFPPEYPFYGGEGIRYHFGYDFFAGALEAQGLPVAWAFNLPGAAGFAAMMVLVFELGRWLFKSWWVGIMAVVLLVTNGSLSFLEFFQDHGTSFPGVLSDIWHSDRYLSVGPYLVDGEVDIVSIFMTLNVFLTQTHLIIGMALVLFVTYGLVRMLFGGEPDESAESGDNGDAGWEEVLRWRWRLSDRQLLALGILFGLSFWLNGVLFIAAAVFFVALFFVAGRRLQMLYALVPAFAALMVLGAEASGHFYFAALVFALGSLFAFGRVRDAIPFLIPAALIALPQAVWLNGGLESQGSIREHTAYLVCSSPQASCNDGGFNFLTLSHYWDFIEYWWLNLGLALPLMVLGAVWGTRRDRKLMLAVMAVFIFANFVQLSRDLGGHNHKVINLWEILMNLFAAFAFVRLWNIVQDDINVLGYRIRGRDVSVLARAIVPVVFLFLVLSGIIDFMTIKNDAHYLVFGDKTPTIDWIEKNTPGDSMFLVAYDELYTAPTLAGRRVFLGYRPWAGSAGYDVPKREGIVAQIYGAPTKGDACRLLVDYGIDYVQIGPSERNNGGKFTLNEGLFSGEFTQAGTVQEAGGPVVIYDVARSCPSGAAAAAP